jgi:O-antigen/teichoic acid export membrane protein
MGRLRRIYRSSVHSRRRRSALCSGLDSMSLQVQAARGLKWQGVEIAGRQLLSLAVFTALARLLDPTAFGLMGLVAVYLAFVGTFVEQGLGTALIQRKDLKPEHMHTVFWTNLALSVLLCIGSMVVARPIASLFSEPSLAPLLRWCSLSLIINGLASVHGRLLVREMDFRRPAVRLLIGNLAGGMVGVAMAVSGMGVWALVGQQLTSALSGSIFIWSTSPYRPRLQFSIRHLSELWAVGGAVFLTGFLWFLSGRADQLIIGKLLGAMSLGYYSVANRLADLAKTSLYQPLGAVALPALSRVQHDRLRLHSAMSRAMELNSVVSFPCLFGLSAVATTFVPLLLGSRWQSSGQVLRLLALYVLLHGMWCITHYALLATGNAMTVAAINFGQTIGVAVACAIGVQFGLRGVVAALMLNDLLMNLPRLYLLWRRTGYSPRRYLRPCLEPMVAAGLMYLVIVGIGRMLSTGAPAWSVLLAQLAAGVGTYLAVMSLLARERLWQLWALVLSAIAQQESRSPASSRVVAVS